MSQAATLNPTKASAAGQYLGFSLQQLRLCHHLLRVKGDYEVSFELLDDLAVHAPDGTMLLEQCKSVTASGSPVADRAVELWKAFAHWGDLAKAGTVNASTTEFNLYVAPAGSATLALDLSGSKTDEAVAAALLKVKALQKINKPAVVDGFIAKFLAAGDDIASAVIRNFSLMIDPDPDESVKGFLRTFLKAETLDNFSAAAIGMARENIDTLIRKGHKPVIAAPKFQANVRTFVRKNNLANLLISTVPKPGTASINSYLNAAPVFVRQLQSVKASPDLLTTAISDWLRATADKINWASEGEVLADSFSDFDERLVRRHKIVCDAVDDTLADKTPEHRGRETYRRCAETEMPLDGSAVPDHFVAGAFNCLADISKLGWHPEYAKLFPPGGDE